MSLGERLRNLRLKTKHTLAEQSEQFGVSVNSIYRWEHGLATPREGVLREMAEYYGVTLGWLQFGDGEDSEVMSDDKASGHIIEKHLLKIFNRLSIRNKYKILGYVERTYIESMDDSMHLPELRVPAVQEVAEENAS